MEEIIKNTETADDNIESVSASDNNLETEIGYTPKYKAGEIIHRSIVDEMKESYLDYSMSVIVSRALPETSDGLKPSQRRILVAMNDLHLTANAHFRKSAKISGDTTGNYHPHGDIVVYPTMVRMAQDFNCRYPLIDGQGNFGSIDGDEAAAMRYTEARMTKITEMMVNDLEKGTVTFVPNYDSTRLEPTILPALFPNLLCNGSDGIAVGMATRIPPHNLGEVVDALREMIARKNKWDGKAIYNNLRQEKEKSEIVPRVLSSTPESYFDNYVATDDINREEKLVHIQSLLHEGNGEVETKLYPEFESDISTEELIKIIPGPDFPTGGIMYDRKEIINAYATGRGRILMRAKASIEEGKNDRYSIIITEIPFQVNKAAMIEGMADLYKEKKIEGISDIRDESNKEGIRVVITLKKDVQPKVILNKLFKYTEMQKAFNANMISLVDGEPRLLNLKNMLELFITHRISVTIRRFEYDLAQAKYRAHILEGYLKALDVIDEIIKTIRGSKTQEDAKTNLIEKFGFTDVQAQAILDMQLRKLAALEREKIDTEHKETVKNIETWNAILSDENKILEVVDNDLAMLKDKYGDDRRTKVVVGGVEEISEEDTVPSEDTFVTISRTGYLKRLNPETYKTQKRGGKGVIGATTKENDYIQHAITCNTHDDLMLFTNRGRVFLLKVYQIPEAGRTAKGMPVVNLIQITQGEIVTGVLTCSQTKESAESKYLFMATKRGIVKKTNLSDFSNIRSSGLISIKLEPNDELKWVAITSGKDQVMLTTHNGKCIRFNESDVRPTGRNTMGVTGIKFKTADDEAISMDIITEGSDTGKVFTLSENGYGKMTELSQYDAQRRSGTGIYTAKINPKTGKLVVSKIFVGDDDTEIVVISTKGQVIRSCVKDIPTLNNRQTSGVRVMHLNDGDTIAAMATL